MVKISRNKLLWPVATSIGCPSSSYRSRTEAVAEQSWAFWEHVNKRPRPKQQCHQRERFRYRLQTSWRGSWIPTGKNIVSFFMSPTSLNIPEKRRTDIEEEPPKLFRKNHSREPQASLVEFASWLASLRSRTDLPPKSIYPDRVEFRLGGLNIATFMSKRRVRGLEKKDQVGERARDRSLALALGRGKQWRKWHERRNMGGRLPRTEYQRDP